MRQGVLVAIVLVCAGLLGTSARGQAPLGTALTYQGELSSGGSPASGAFDLRFSLFDAAAGGNQIGETLCADNLAVSNGRFTVLLDFGAAFTGEKRFLQIEVRQDSGLGCSDASGYTALTPRQELTPTPNASFALNAATADSALTAGDAATLGGRSASFFSNAANLTGTVPGSALSGAYTSALSLSNPANVFSGNGAAITNLNATNISAGVLDAARMPNDWAAGGDLSGVYPNPTIAPGAVTLGKLDPGVQSVLSNLTGVPSTIGPLDAVAWGNNDWGQTNVPALPAGVTYTAVAGGPYHSLALRSDGRVVGWGFNNDGQRNIPALPAGVTYTAVAAGNRHGLAVRSDGTVAAWGDNAQGQTDVPALPAGLTYTAVAAGYFHSLALRSDGTVVAWGNNDFGQTDVPVLPQGVTYTTLACGAYHSLAVRSDETVVAWGLNNFGQTNVTALPAGVTYTAVAGGFAHSLAVRSDGTVVGWGRNESGQTSVPVLPAGVTYTAVAAGTSHSLALRSDATAVGWGRNERGQANVPTLPDGVTYTAVAAGDSHSLALRNYQQAAYLDSTAGLRIGSSAPPPAVGGISIAGNSAFAGGLAAASFTGSGSGLTNLNAANLTGTIGDGLLSSNIPRLNTGNTFTGGVAAPSFSGDGAGLTNLNAASLTGTIPDARLSNTIPRLNSNNSFSGAVAAASFSGSGAGLTNLNASNINTGTVRQTVLPVSAWSNQLPVNVINPTSYTTVGGTSQVFAMRPGVAVVSWSTSAYTNVAGTGFVVRVRAVSGGFVGVGIGTSFYFNQTGVHQTISGNAVVPTTSGSTTFTLEVIRVAGAGNYQTDQFDSLTATIINIGQ